MQEIGQCPSCETWLKVSEREFGDHAECPECGLQLSLQQLRRTSTVLRTVVPIDPVAAQPRADFDDAEQLPPLDQPYQFDSRRHVASSGNESRAELDILPADDDPDSLSPNADDSNDERIEPLKEEIRSPFGSASNDGTFDHQPVHSRVDASLDSVADEEVLPKVVESSAESGAESGAESVVESGAESGAESSAESGAKLALNVNPTVLVTDANRRRRRNPLVEVAKVVAGGVVGLALAQLLIWWMPGNERRDPFELAPRMPGWLHFVLPPDLRVAPMRDDEREVWDAPNGTSLGPLLDRVDRFRPLADSETPESLQPENVELPAATPAAILPDPFRSEEDLPGDQPGDQPGDAPRPAPNGAASPRSRLIAKPVAMVDRRSRSVASMPDANKEATQGVDRQLPDRQFSGLPPADPPSDDTLPAISIPAPGPVYTGAQLQSALASVTLQMRKLSAASSRSARTDAARMMYCELCDVAQIVSFIDPSDTLLGERMNAAQAMLERIAANASLYRLIGRTGGDWLLFPSRTSDGIVFGGQVVEVEQIDNWYVSHIRISDANRSILTLIRDGVAPSLDPRVPYEVGDWLVAFGTILDDADATLPPALQPQTTIRYAMHARVETDVVGNEVATRRSPMVAFSAAKVFFSRQKLAERK